MFATAEEFYSTCMKDIAIFPASWILFLDPAFENTA